MIMASVGSAVQAACRNVREDALARAGTDDLAEALRRLGQPVEATVDAKPGDESQRFSMHAFGAVFAEVAVDPDLGETRVRSRGPLRVTDRAPAGQRVGVLLDTGAYASILTKAAAGRLGLATRDTAEFMYGVGGASRIQLARIKELRLGSATRGNLRVRVGGERPIPGVDFILGDDFFREVDMEFDYARRVVRFFRPIDCGNSSHRTRPISVSRCLPQSCSAFLLT